MTPAIRAHQAAPPVAPHTVAVARETAGTRGRGGDAATVADHLGGVEAPAAKERS